MIAGMIFYVPFVRLGYKFRIIGERYTNIIVCTDCGSSHTTVTVLSLPCSPQLIQIFSCIQIGGPSLYSYCYRQRPLNQCYQNKVEYAVKSSINCISSYQNRQYILCLSIKLYCIIYIKVYSGYTNLKNCKIVIKQCLYYFVFYQ